MSRLQEAQARLGAALSRLEAALARPAAGGRISLAERVGRIGELERELERLNRDHMALEATVDQVTARLDNAIRRLKASVED
jgi:predicted  nucleic acid-binding Zn-ribbon protein